MQFAFIDGNHHLDYALLDLFYLDLMLDVGSVVALHDMWMPALQHVVSFWEANRAYEAVTVGAGELANRPCASVKRGCGDPDRRPAYFREHIEPYVDQSVLLLRKLDDDRRAWDEFNEYIG